ncbi:MAG: ion transporter [Herminiimonas sp.]|nr:ion transporter [Herminiimonas sp.]
MKKKNLPEPLRLALVSALVVSIPAFYLMLTGPTATYRHLGSLLYGVTALLMAIDFGMHRRRAMLTAVRWRPALADIVILVGAMASAWPSDPPWAVFEWVLRLGFSGVVFVSLSTMLARLVAPHHLFQVLAIAVVLLAVAGGGFYWLEPRVLTYADGLWLAFITGATVGYGDLVPSTPAARIFAVFIVLLGYALFSVVTASIAALFVSEDEKRFEKELHADIRSLRAEIAALRSELHQPDANRIR